MLSFDATDNYKDSNVSNYCLTIQYDGSNYFGWQRHGSKPTIQHSLEQALFVSFSTKCKIVGSSRTDRGVHAFGQVINVRLTSRLDEQVAIRILNDNLPKDIQVLTFSRVSNHFHARKDAIGKKYRYVIHNGLNCPTPRINRVWHIARKLDISAMKTACSLLVGEHDFATFATRTKFGQKSTVREIKSFELDYTFPEITLTVYGNSFLYKMVRNIVMAIVKVGDGRYSAHDISRMLAAKDRRASPGTAPGSGLYLDTVYY